MPVIDDIDHFVLTITDLNATVAFYTALGMRAVTRNGRNELRFGSRKINLHLAPGQFQPAAARPVSGSADLCFTVTGTMAELEARLADRGLAVELGPVPREGAQGPMRSVYLRDPDGNLIELAVYE